MERTTGGRWGRGDGEKPRSARPGAIATRPMSTAPPLRRAHNARCVKLRSGAGAPGRSGAGAQRRGGARESLKKGSHIFARGPRIRIIPNHLPACQLNFLPCHPQPPIPPPCPSRSSTNTLTCPSLGSARVTSAGWRLVYAGPARTSQWRDRSTARSTGTYSGKGPGRTPPENATPIS